jgi:tRNA pseudouridine55 synthase
LGRKKSDPGTVHGLVRIDKPGGPTSHTVMREVQRVLSAGRSGHAGTLDPMATGLLVVLLGEGTKLSRWVMGCDKTYLARVTLGQETDTLDAQGQVTGEVAIPESALNRATVEEALVRFLGEQEQLPPIYSAIKRDGRTLMDRARAGEVPEVAPRQVRCDSLSLVAIEGPELLVRVACGSGYYVRSFARDLAQALGTVGHLSALTRERVGPWSLEDARAPHEIEIGDVVLIAESLPRIAKVTLSDEDVENVRHGRRLTLELDSDEVMALESSGQAVAMLARETGDEWRIERGFRMR